MRVRASDAAVPPRFRHNPLPHSIDDSPIIGPVPRFQLARLGRNLGDIDRPIRIDRFDDATIFEQLNLIHGAALPPYAGYNGSGGVAGY
jgi:hypothetical protein